MPVVLGVGGAVGVSVWLWSSVWRSGCSWTVVLMGTSEVAAAVAVLRVSSGAGVEPPASTAMLSRRQSSLQGQRCGRGEPGLAG